MASFTDVPVGGGTHGKFVPEIWSKEAQIQREAKLFMAKRVDRFDLDFAAGGDYIHIPKVTDLTAGDISQDGSLSDQANTEGEVTLTVNKWKGVSINVPDLLKVQAKYDLMKLYTEKMGYALGKVVETDLLGLYSSITASKGTAATDLTDATLRNAVQALDDSLVPFDDRHAIVLPAQKNALLGIDKFVRYDSIPFSVGENPTRKGMIGELYGVEFVVSPLIATVATEAQNIMWHRSAFGLALVKDIKVENFARTNFADRLGASELYGVAILRNDHSLKLKS